MIVIILANTAFRSRLQAMDPFEFVLMHSIKDSLGYYIAAELLLILGMGRTDFHPQDSQSDIATCKQPKTQTFGLRTSPQQHEFIRVT